MGLKIGAIVAGVLAMSSAAMADNLVQNPDFVANAAGWGIDPYNGSAAWNAGDGSPSAGSLEITATGDGLDDGIVSVSQCITAIGTGPWVFGARIRTVSPGTISAQNLGVVFLGGPNCDVGLAGGGYAEPGATVPGVQGNYIQYSGSIATDPMPGGGPTHSVLIMYQLDVTSGTAVSRIDQLYFGPVGTTPVGLTGFTVE